MNPYKVNSSASAANLKPRQGHSPLGARETLLSKRSAKSFFALVVCQLAALFCLAGPSFALTIDSVVPSKGKVTVNWSGGTAPYQLEKSTDLKTWEPVDTETSATSLASIQTSPNAFYRVRNGSTGGGASGGNKTDTTAPSVPTGVSAANNSCSQVTVSWTASADSGRNATGVKGYYVYRDGIFLRAVLAPATLTSDVGLTASTTYSYTVRAYDGATNFSGYSTAVTTTTPVCADNTPPSVPSGVAALPSSCSQIDITWSPSTDSGSGLQSYSVYRNNAFWKQVFAPATSTSDTGLAAGTTVNYAVMAIDNAGNQSALSTASTATTSACGDTTAPSVPAGLIVTATSCSQINLSWGASTDNAGGTGVGSYYIYRDGGYLKAVVSGTSTFDTGLAASASHSYAVTAVDNAGNQSAKSAALSATTPACADTIAPTVPLGLTPTAPSTNQINLSWSTSLDNPGGTGLQGYYVYRKGGYVGYAPTPSYSSTGLAPGTQYCFTVTALDNSGNQSGLSVQACATTQTPACSYSLSSSSASAPASGSSSTVTVNTGNGCSWTPTSNAGWLTCTPASATGIGTLTWTAAANTSTSSRSGTITVQGQTFTVTEAGAACTYTLSAPSASVVATGGSGSVNVTAGAGCTWSASSSDTTWLTITGASGNGSGSVSYSVAANSGTTSRTGTLTIGGQVFTVSQAGAACTYTLSSASASALASGTTSSVTVNAGTGCSWAPTSNAGWLTCTPVSGTGTGTLTWTAAANTGTASRTGTITVQGQTFTVTQPGVTCTFTLSSSSVSIGSIATIGSVNVTANSSSCGWTAVSGASWLSITAGSTGTGNSSVTYSATANTLTSSRTGTLTIPGQTFTVTQAGATTDKSVSNY